MTKNIILNSITILFIIFIGIILYHANTGSDFIFFRLMSGVPMGDKIGHLCLVGTLAFLLNLSLKARTIKLGNFKLLLGSVLVFIFITIEEFTQIAIANRTFDLLDLMCNYIGIALATFAILQIFKHPKETTIL